MITPFKKTTNMALLAMMIIIWPHAACLAEKEKGQSIYAPDRLTTYKKVGDVELKLRIFDPKGHQVTDRAPVIVEAMADSMSSLTAADFPNAKKSRRKEY